MENSENKDPFDAAFSGGVITPEVMNDAIAPSNGDVMFKAIGAATATIAIAAGTICLVAGVVKVVTWALGGIAGFLLAAAPWIAVALGVAAFSAAKFYA